MVLSMLSAQGDQPTVAILYFTGQGLTNQQTKSLRNRFSSSLASTERVSMIINNQLEIYSASPNASSGAKIIARSVSPIPKPVPLPNALARDILMRIMMTMFTKGISNSIIHQTGLLIIFKRTIKL